VTFSPTPTLCFGIHWRKTLNSFNQQKSVFADDGNTRPDNVFEYKAQ
jgi:hypothetical protein